MNQSITAQGIVLAHCTYTARDIQEVFTCETLRLAPLTLYLATATVVQQDQALAGMIFRSDLPLTDLDTPALINCMIGTVLRLRELLEDDPGRVMIVDPVDHRRRLPRFPEASVCREIFLHAFLRPAAAGTV